MASPKIKLSVLDQSPVKADGTMADALQNTIALAKHCDGLGYHRYWVAEHHNTRSFASTAPEILIAKLADETKHMRIGSGGVMMTHYSPLKVAESFRLLEALHPGRIDLGLGRAPGGDAKTTAALQAGPKKFSLDAFPAQVELTAQYLRDEVGPAKDHPLAGIFANPTINGMPDMWLLGSGPSSASYAAHFGYPFSYAHFINADGGPDVMAQYRMNYQPSKTYPEPRGSVGVFALCCDSAEEAQREGEIRTLWVERFLRGEGGAFPTPADAAENKPTSPAEEAQRSELMRRAIIGSPEQCKERLTSLAMEYGVDELIVVTITYDEAVRRKSYSLLAEAFDLERPE